MCILLYRLSPFLTFVQWYSVVSVRRQSDVAGDGIWRACTDPLPRPPRLVERASNGIRFLQSFRRWCTSEFPPILFRHRTCRSVGPDEASPTADIGGKRVVLRFQQTNQSYLQSSWSSNCFHTSRALQEREPVKLRGQVSTLKSTPKAIDPGRSDCLYTL